MSVHLRQGLSLQEASRLTGLSEQALREMAGLPPSAKKLKQEMIVPDPRPREHGELPAAKTGRPALVSLAYHDAMKARALEPRVVLSAELPSHHFIEGIDVRELLNDRGF